jgi:hypothetical protein
MPKREPLPVRRSTNLSAVRRSGDRLRFRAGEIRIAGARGNIVETIARAMRDFTYELVGKAKHLA